LYLLDGKSFATLDCGSHIHAAEAHLSVIQYFADAETKLGDPETVRNDLQIRLGQNAGWSHAHCTMHLTHDALDIEDHLLKDI
jgi:hypothetical protein